ncbi:MAG: hypothetical protein R3F47_17565 [Gammaproteobacteria bacterium]|jgi:hypothetical protein
MGVDVDKVEHLDLQGIFFALAQLQFAQVDGSAVEIAGGIVGEVVIAGAQAQIEETGAVAVSPYILGKTNYVYRANKINSSSSEGWEWARGAYGLIKIRPYRLTYRTQ